MIDLLIDLLKLIRNLQKHISLFFFFDASNL